VLPGVDLILASLLSSHLTALSCFHNMFLHVFNTIDNDLVSWADAWTSFLLQKSIVQVVVFLLPVSSHHSVQFVKQDIVVSLALIMIDLCYLCRSCRCRYCKIVLFAFLIEGLSIKPHLIPTSL
jgi:hypothetical protein